MTTRIIRKGRLRSLSSIVFFSLFFTSFFPAGVSTAKESQYFYLAEFVVSWLADSNNPQFKAQFDFVADGIINFKDFAVLAEHYAYPPVSVNLEVVLEMMDAGEYAGTGYTTIWPHSYIFLDSDDYDGATYYFEVVAKNVNVTTAYNIILYDVTNSANKVTISVPANTSVYTRFRSASWSPASNATITYGVLLPADINSYDIAVYAARIIVVQVDATKTRIQIPLLGYTAMLVPPTDIDYLASATYGQGTAGKYSYYKKDTNVLADINSWSLEAVLRSSINTKTAYAALFDKTDNNQVTNAVVSTASTDNTLLSVDFTNTETNFDEGHDFEVRTKVSAMPATVYIQRAALYCRLTNLTKAEVYRRVGMYLAITTTGRSCVECRQLLDTSAYSTPVIYSEITAACVDNAEVAFLEDDLTDDSGTANASDVEGFNFNSASKVRIRSGILTVTDDDRFYLKTINTTNGLTISNAWIIIDCSVSAQTYTETINDGVGTTEPMQIPVYLQ